MQHVRRRGFYRHTDKAIDAYYAGDDEALAQALEDLADATGYEQRAQSRAKYQRRKEAANELAQSNHH